MIESLWRCREVDNNKAKLFLTKYLKNYNPEDAQIKLKISHIYRVAELSKRLATMLNLSEEDILLAELIGLLHDIGRFEQIKNYHTFLDKESIDHAEYGNKILFEDDLIRNFITEYKYDEIIKTAISNHNKPCISNDLTNYERLHAMIIRDADKTDILYLSTVGDEKTIFENSNLCKETITDEIYYDLIQREKINYNNIHSAADILLCHFAYIYDYNFSTMLKFVDSKGYIDKMYNRFSFEDDITEERYKNIYLHTKTYIKKKTPFFSSGGTSLMMLLGEMGIVLSVSRGET